jgi:uncharacterized protein
MTPEERQMLTDLANKVAQTPAPPIDKEAEDFIRTRIGSRPDALYLMTQTVLIQNMALEQAKQQIQQLQHNTSASQGSSSFLGSQSPNQGQGAYRAAGGGAPQQGYSAPPPTYQAVPVSGSGSVGGSPAGGGSSFLRSAAQTAAGVAAGALAFEGISSLFHGMGHMGGGFGGSGLFGGGGVGGYGAPEETIVNNYYDNPQTESRDDFNSGDNSADDTQYADASQDYDDTSDTSSDDFSGDDDGSGGDFLA